MFIRAPEVSHNKTPTTLSAHEPLGLHADVSALPDDDVIEDGNIDDLAGFNQFLSEGDVLSGRRRIPAGVVMNDDGAGA